MKIISLQQRTPEWHKWRSTGVSASEAIVVLGQCPLKTIYRLFTEKKGITLPDNLDANPFVQRGIRLEATARKSFEDRHNTLVLPLCAESEDFPFLSPYLTHKINIHLKTISCALKNLRVALHLEK
jgi:putative phage-type endonuclease